MHTVTGLGTFHTTRIPSSIYARNFTPVDAERIIVSDTEVRSRLRKYV